MAPKSGKSSGGGARAAAASGCPLPPGVRHGILIALLAVWIAAPEPWTGVPVQKFDRTNLHTPNTTDLDTPL